MNNKQLILIMKAVNGQNPDIYERDLWLVDDNTAGYNKSLEEVVSGLDSNPLFKGRDCPTNKYEWNRWRCIGKRSGGET